MTLRPPVSASDHSIGSAAAPVTLVEYGDYQCPHCAVADAVVRRLQQHFGDRLRFVFRNFPLTEVHPAAEPAAELAEGAAVRGQFWPMHDAIFAWSRQHGPESLGAEAFEALATSLALDGAELATEVNEHRYLERIRADFQSGVRSGVNGTPSFFVNGHRFDGPATFEALNTAIGSALPSR